jgi:hypothetical protein
MDSDSPMDTTFSSSGGDSAAINSRVFYRSLNEGRSKSDKKSYANGFLDCGLEFLIISSKDIPQCRNIASAALTVEAGSFADPIEGLYLTYHTLSCLIYLQLII